MKTSLIFTIATALALGMASCSGNGPGGDGPGEKTNLIIKLEKAKVPHTRATEAPATTADPAITDARSVIFVADDQDNIVQAVGLVEAEATGSTGQVIPTAVPVGSSVYIVANIPAGEETAIKGKRTLADVKAYTSAISTQSGFSTPTMANVDGVEADVQTTGGTQTITVRIEPLIARLEIVAMQAKADAAGNTVTGFKVTGVYVSEYYPNFDYTGTAPAGDAMVSLKAGLEAAGDATAIAAVYTGWASYMKDEGSWAATGTPLVAGEPGGANRVWAYNLVGKGTPHIIFKLEGIEYTNAGGQTVTLSGARYITVEGYEGLSTGFAHGSVYRIGKIDTVTGDSNFQFDFSHLNGDPYEESVGLTVKVDVVPWVINDYTPTLRP